MLRQYWVVLLTPISGEARCFEDRAAAYREAIRWATLFEAPMLESDGYIWIIDVMQSELGQGL